MMYSGQLTVRQIEIIDKVKEIAEQLSYVPTLRELLDNYEWPTLGAIRYHFGSYADLLKIAGLKASFQLKRYTVKELHSMLYAYIMYLGRIPSQYEVRTNPKLPSDGTFLNLYPSWESLIKALGFSMSWCTPEVRQRLLDDLRNKYVELGYKLPSPQDIQNDPKMDTVYVYMQIFGDLNYAHFAAGIVKDYYARQRDQISKSIWKVYKNLGRVPKLKDPGMPNEKLIAKVFGSYGAALDYIGLKPNRIYYTKKMLIRQLKDKSEQLGRTPTWEETDNDPDMASIHTFRSFFGSYREALLSAKLSPNYGGKSDPYTKEVLIEMLQNKYQELGNVTPKMHEIDEDPDLPSGNTFARVFGTYNLALEAAGLPKGQVKRKYSSEQLIQQLQKKADELGRAPMQKDVNDDPDMASVNTLSSTFGSFNEALIAAGIRPNRKRQYSDEELLEKLQEKYIEVGYYENGKTPTSSDINEDSRMASTHTYEMHFGTVGHAKSLVEEMLKQ